MIPKDLESLGIGVFNGCKNLSEIHCLFEHEPFMREDVFEDGPEERTVYFVSNNFDEKKFGGTKKSHYHVNKGAS